MAEARMPRRGTDLAVPQSIGRQRQLIDRGDADDSFQFSLHRSQSVVGEIAVQVGEVGIDIGDVSGHVEGVKPLRGERAAESLTGSCK